MPKRGSFAFGFEGVIVLPNYLRGVKLIFLTHHQIQRNYTIEPLVAQAQAIQRWTGRELCFEGNPCIIDPQICFVSGGDQYLIDIKGNLIEGRTAHGLIRNLF